MLARTFICLTTMVIVVAVALMLAFTAFTNDESGATAIEYGLIAALVAIGLIAALTALGASLSKIFTHVATALNTAGS